MSLLNNHADRVHRLFSSFCFQCLPLNFSIAHVHTFLQLTSSILMSCAVQFLCALPPSPTLLTLIYLLHEVFFLFCVVQRVKRRGWFRVYVVEVKSLLVVVKTRAHWGRLSFVQVCSQAHVLRPCRHLLSFAVPTHTLGRDKAARQAADRELLEWQQQRAARLGLRWLPKPPSVLDVLPLAVCGCIRWSRPFEMVICVHTVSWPCHPGGDQACQPGEASRRLPQTWQKHLALLMHRRTLTKNRLRSAS